MMSRTPVDLSLSQLFERLCKLLCELEQLDQEQQANREKLAGALLTYHQQGKESENGGDHWEENPIVIIAGEAYEEENDMLRSVGCRVKLCGELREITFPPGTRERPYKYRTLYAHFTLTLPEPDGREFHAFERLQRDSVYILRFPSSFLPTELPSFRQVREKQAVSLLDLSLKTGLGIRLVKRVDAEGKGKVEYIDRLLIALSELSGQRYSRWNVGGFTYL